MQYNSKVFTSSDKPLEDREFPDTTDLADDDDEQLPPALRDCPACGDLFYDQAQQCPHCKEWIFPASQGWRSSRKWYVRGGLYLTKTLVLNWMLWLVMAAIAAVVTLLEMLGWLGPSG